MSADPTITDDTVATDSAVPADQMISDADAHTLEGRTRVVLPPSTPDAADALAEQVAAETAPQPAPPPTYAEMLHLMPR